MQRAVSLFLLALILAVSVLEQAWQVTPLEQLLALLSWARAGRAELGPGGEPQTVIRLGVASWQMDEFPWAEAIRGYEEAHPGVRIRMSTLPEGSLNSVLLFWTSGYTAYDAIVAWADEEIHPFIDYNWKSPDPRRRSLLIDLREHLSPEQIEEFVPGMFGGSSRADPRTGRVSLYEIPWMGEVLALNYNRKFFRERGLTQAPRSWEEVEEACRKLKGLRYQGAEVAPLAMNFAQGGFFAQNCYLPMLAAFKQGRGIADEKGRLDVESPEAVRVFETLKRWYQAGYISPHCMVSSDVEQDLRVMRAAMYPHWQSRGLWALQDHGPEVIAIGATPGARSSGALVCTYGAIIPRCSPVIREAVAFCYQALARDTYGFQSAVARGWRDKLTGRTKGGGKMPALKRIYQEVELPPGIKDLGQTLERGYSYPDPVHWSHCAEILVVEFQKYLSSPRASAPEALAGVRRRLAEEVYAEE